MALYLHPTTSVADAALHAFRHGGRLVADNGRVKVAPGRDYDQAEKALKIQALTRLAAEMETRHTV